MSKGAAVAVLTLAAMSAVLAISILYLCAKAAGV